MLEKKKKFDISDYNMIVFEEIYFNNGIIIEKIYNFMIKNNNKIYLANGDPEQLDINDILTTKKKIQYINQIFPNYVTLKINKRCNSSKIDDIKDYIVNNNNLQDKDIIYNIVHNYFKPQIIDNIKTSRGLTYYNKTKITLNDIIHKINLKSNQQDNKYYVGLKLLCAIFHKRDKNNISRNFEFIITKVDDKHITIKDELIDQEYIYKYKDIDKYFSFTYTNTVHSSQGLTIHDAYTIYNWQEPHVTVKWFWVAITRSSDLNKVYFYNGKNLNISDDKINIDSYISQDKLKGMTWHDVDYVDDEWIKNELLKNKYICNICSDIIVSPSIDRIDNNKCHLKSNCQIVCMNCNRSKSNRSHLVSDILHAQSK